jgi:hypothetical protein
MKNNISRQIWTFDNLSDINIPKCHVRSTEISEIAALHQLTWGLSAHGKLPKPQVNPPISPAPPRVVEKNDETLVVM